MSSVTFELDAMGAAGAADVGSVDADAGAGGGGDCVSAGGASPPRNERREPLETDFRGGMVV